MAIFGIQEESTHGAAGAALAALDIRRALTALNAQREADGVIAIGFGVGIHTGPVILGAVGLHERSDFTAIGDAVNVAARLEGLSKDYEVDVVMSEQTYAELPPGRFQERLLGESTVRGKRDPMRVYTLD
jgi:class 3 adenylate cyclase